jgi:hypothetical protein
MLAIAAGMLKLTVPKSHPSEKDMSVGHFAGNDTFSISHQHLIPHHYVSAEMSRHGSAF